MNIFLTVCEVEGWWVRIFPGGGVRAGNNKGEMRSRAMDGKSVHGKERWKPDW